VLSPAYVRVGVGGFSVRNGWVCRLDALGRETGSRISQLRIKDRQCRLQDVGMFGSFPSMLISFITASDRFV
jgi:hypothetical protein